MKNLVLVTGGNGYLALYIIQKLLTKDYAVRATLRSLDKKDQVITSLEQQNVPNLERLSFVAVDLNQDTGWDEAMRGVTNVMSVAAPIFVNGEKVTAKMEQTATEGTLRILKAAERNQVSRVVMTSNLGAVGFSNLNSQHITTESDWTNVDQRGLNLYEKSKLIAEKAAWNYLAETNSSMEFVTVNPGAMLGPTLNNHISGSFGFIANLLNPSAHVANIEMNIVDVRDVAEMQVQAMLTPQAAGNRFLAVADQVISLPQIVELIRQKRPELVDQLPTKQIPNWFIKLAAPFNARAAEGKLLLSINHQVSNQKAKKILGWQPQFSAQQAILAAVDAIEATK